MFLLYAILLPFTIATTCYYNDYNVGSNNFVGFTSNTNIDPSRCLNDNGIICCKCPYGKMVPPSAGTNYFSMTGQSDCINCEIGSYSDNTTKGICQACPSGKYQDQVGQGSCNSCSTGQTTLTFLIATNWPGGSYPTNNAKSNLYGAYSISHCIAIPSGYILNTFSSSVNGYSSYLSSSSFNVYTACSDQYAVASTTSSSSCSYCPSTNVFFAGGSTYGSLSFPVSVGIGGYYFYYDYMYSRESFSTTTTSSAYQYLFKVEISNVQGAKCLDICPIGYKSYSPVKGINACQKCSSEEGEYGSEPGYCSVCPESSYVLTDGVTSCDKCPWPFLSHVPSKQLKEYHSCIGDLSSITFPIFCLCLKQSEVAIICILITVFFSINLFVFFYFGSFNQSSGNATKSFHHESISINSLEVESAVEKKKNILNKRGIALESILTYFLIIIILLLDVLIGLLTYIFIPYVDNITDLAFLLSNKFVSLTFFMLFAGFFCLPGLYFFKTLIDMKAVPKFYILRMPTWMLFDEYDSLYKVVIGTIVLFPFVLINSPVLFPMLLSGNLLYGTKAFAVRPVANLWLHIWTGARFSAKGSDEDIKRQNDIAYADEFPVDEKILNESLFSHFLGETIPILIIQIFNNIYLNSWNGLSYFSLAFSLCNAASGLYRIGYYRLICKIPIEKIPVNFEIFGIKVFGDQYITELTGTDSTVKHTTSFWKKDNIFSHRTKLNMFDDDDKDTRSLLLEMKANNEMRQQEIKSLIDSLSARVEKLEQQ